MAKTALIFRHPSQTWGHSWLGCFAEGLEHHGWDVRLAVEWRKSDMLVIWGTRRRKIIEAQKEHGGDVCVLERGYLLDRMNDWASVSFGGELNGRAEFRGPVDDPTRWEKHFAHCMQPWRKANGGYALVLGQIKGDMSLRGVDLTKFYTDAEKAFTALGYETYYRPHPVVEERANRDPGSLKDALAGAGVAVTWNSNSGVDAVLAGVPTIAMDKGSMVWDVTGHELAMPPTPDRTAWAHALAYKQWSREEMQSGECWACLTQ